MLPDDGVGAETTVVSYPTSTEALGRGIDLSQSGMKKSKLVYFQSTHDVFAFDPNSLITYSMRSCR